MGPLCPLKYAPAHNIVTPCQRNGACAENPLVNDFKNKFDIYKRNLIILFFVYALSPHLITTRYYYTLHPTRYSTINRLLG